MTLSYDEFIKLFSSSTIFCKLLNYGRNHFGFQYKLGKNIDHVPFNPNGSCLSGGLYFTTLEYLPQFISYGINIAYIELCKDALFYCDPEGFKWKTNKFIITKIEQTEEICKLAVKQNGSALRYVGNQTDEICKLAIQQDGYALRYVGNQTDKICKLAVQQNGDALQYVKNQTDDICKLAVQQNGYALQYVKNQTDDICKLAVLQNGNTLYM